MSTRRNLLGLSGQKWPRAKSGYKASGRDVLVCLFQRGAADGLSIAVPYGDADYYSQRPDIALPPPGQSGGVLDLDGYFGLHPAMAALMPAYAAGRLALVPACGLPHGSRSHFDAQALVEGGVASKTALTDSGWLGRYLAQTASSGDSLFRAVTIAGNVSASLNGAPEALAIDDLASFGLGDVDPSYTATLATLYRMELPHAATAQNALSAMEQLAAANPGQFAPDNGAVYPETDLGQRLLQAGQMIKSTLGAQVICIDVGGWDLHENLPNFMPGVAGELAAALAAFDTDMGARMAGITVLVMTEFGRRVVQNGSKGTDHGYGGCLLTLGGGVYGGQVAGEWPGLANAKLVDGTDLAITTDLRDLLVQMLRNRLGFIPASDYFPEHETAEVFPLFASL